MAVKDFSKIGLKGKGIHLAISGTYSTGKSTTTEALSILTGIPRTHAMTSREILLDLVPGKQVQELSASELTALGLRRLEERIHNESGDEAFISDGSVIHEWVYGKARLQVGINPGAGILARKVKSFVGSPYKKFYNDYMNAYGVVTLARAQRIYDAYVHLPVEFEMRADGHRPVSENFRRLSDELLLDAIRRSEVPYLIVGGSLEERLRTIVKSFNLPQKVSIEDAMHQATKRVVEATSKLLDDDRYHDARRRKSLAQRIRYAVRY